MGSTKDRWHALHELRVQLFALEDITDQLVRFGDGLCGLIGAERFAFSNANDNQIIDQAAEQHADEQSLTIHMPHACHDQGNFIFFFQNDQAIEPETKDFLGEAVNYLGEILYLEEAVLEKQSQSDQLSIIRSALTTEGSNKGPGQIYETLTQEICSVFDLQKVEICIKEPDNETFATKYRAELNAEDGWESTISRTQIDDLDQSKCFLSGEIVFSSEKVLPEEKSANGTESRHENWVAIPIRDNDEIIGSISLWGRRSKRFSADTVGEFSIFSTLISAIYRSSRLLNETVEQSWISNVMQQISDASLRYESLDDLLNEITRIIPLMIDIEKCAVFLANTANSEYIYEAQFGFSDEEEPMLAMLPFTKEGQLALHALESGELFVRIPPIISKETELDTGKKFCMIFALSAHEKLHGFLVIDMSGNPLKDDGARSNSIDAIQAISQQVALSIENARLEEEKEIEAYTTTVLLQSAEAIALAASIEEALENICNLLPFFIGVDTTIIYLLNQQQRTFHLNAYQSNSWKKQSKNLPLQFRQGTYQGLDGFLGKEEPSVFKIADIPPEDWLKVNDHFIFEKVEDFGSSEPLLMLFPLHIQSENSGFMLIRETEDAVENRDKKVEILNGIARQISVAVQNVQLKNEIVDRERMRREFQFAQEIQRTFLPEDKLEIPGYQIDSLWRPALQLGGDFFDMVHLGDNQYGFVIADVSDKGMPAALYMTVARTLIHAAAIKNTGPAETLLQVNQQLLENSSEGLFVTVIYGILNAFTGDFIFANAGHNRPLKILEKSISWLEKGGMPLGITESISLDEYAVRINPGEEIILYTDGVTECRSSVQGYFGEQRLEDILRSNLRKRDGRSNLKVIDEKLLAFQGSDAPSDDVTILTIRRLVGK